MRPIGHTRPCISPPRGAVIAALLVATAGCGADNPVAPLPMPSVGITITPETDTIIVGQFADFSTTITYANGTTIDSLQNYVTFSVDAPDLVIVPSTAPTGSVRLYGRVPGVLTLTAVYNGPGASYRGAATTASRRIRIVPDPKAPVPNLEGTVNLDKWDLDPDGRSGRHVHRRALYRYRQGRAARIRFRQSRVVPSRIWPWSGACPGLAAAPVGTVSAGSRAQFGLDGPATIVAQRATRALMAADAQGGTRTCDCEL